MFNFYKKIEFENTQMFYQIFIQNNKTLICQKW